MVSWFLVLFWRKLIMFCQLCVLNNLYYLSKCLYMILTTQYLPCFWPVIFIKCELLLNIRIFLVVSLHIYLFGNVPYYRYLLWVFLYKLWLNNCVFYACICFDMSRDNKTIIIVCLNIIKYFNTKTTLKTLTNICLLENNVY